METPPRTVRERRILHERPAGPGPDEASSINRRGFLGTGAGARRRGGIAGAGREAAGPDRRRRRPNRPCLPKRNLGRTGVEVSILNLGTWRSVGLDRILRFAWANGVRYVDTAKSYGSEPAIGRWMQAMPEVRKELFLVTKDHPDTPSEMIKQLDERLAALQDRLRRSDLHPRRGRPRHRDRGRVAQEQGIQGNRRGDPQVGQGEVRRLLDAPPAPARDPPGRRRGRVRRRDHAAEQPLDRRGRPR